MPESSKKHGIKKAIAVVAAFFVLSGLATGVFINYIFPQLSGLPGFQLLNPRFPIVVNRTEQVRLADGLDTNQVYGRVRSSVVTVLSYRGSANPFDKNYSTPVLGAGFIVTGDGYIFTSKQLLGSPQNSATVFLDSGKTYPASIVAFDAKSDLALLKIPAGNLPVMQLGSAASLAIGDKIIGVGGSLVPFSNPVQSALVSARYGLLETYPLILSSEQQTQTFGAETLPKAFLGGPLLDHDARVAGMNTSGAPLPAEYLQQTLNNFLNAHSLARGAWGVRYTPVTPAVATLLGLPANYGALLLGSAAGPSVEPGSAAAAAGLREGDFLYKIQEHELDGNFSFEDAVSSYAPGQTVTVSFYRGGIPQSINLVTK